MIKISDKIKYTFYSHSKAETIINESDVDDVFESIYTTVISIYKTFKEKFQAALLIQL